MADTNAGLAMLMAALNGQGGGSAGSSTVAAALTGSPLAAVAPVLAEAVKDTPTNQTGQASSGGATRANWSFGSGDMTIQSKSSGTASTGAKSTAQDAGGSNGAGSAVAAMPWWGWLALAGGGLLVLVLLLRRR